MNGTVTAQLRRRALTAIALLTVGAGGVVVGGAPPAAASTLVTNVYAYTGATQTFTVPAGVTSLTVTLKGGQGGIGGGDSQGSPTPGGYQGVVTGTISVTPGTVLTIATGSGGGTGTSSQGSAPGGSAGQNPLTGYDGAVGGKAGPAGSSGGGGGSGAASVIQINGVDIVAGGAGGNGGNGQFLPIVGRRAEDNHVARADATSTTGRPGMDTSLACTQGYSCDGGASGAGGGGAQGGERGAVQYGGASATEYFGFGGYPGANSTGGFTSLTATYDYYAGNSAAGSITISYDDGAPSVPLRLAGTAKKSSVDLTWDAPSSSGASAITDYKVEYATSLAGTYATFNDGVSTNTDATVTGLTNGTTYYFRVSAINSQGTGPTATTTIGIVPSDVPAAPTVTGLVPFAAGIHVDFTAPASNSTITGYEYRLDSGAWSTGTVSGNRMTISGLVNGRTYSVEIRAVNAIGAGSASSPAQTAKPRDVAGAPSGLLAVAGNARVDLSWSAPTSDNGAAITDYKIETATSVGGTYSTYNDGVSTATTAALTGLANGTTYYVRVSAVNSVGAGATTTPAVATPFTTPSAPSVSLGGVDGALNATITPAFNGGSVVTSYEYRIGMNGTWQSTGDLATTFSIAGLANGTAYDVFVRAINAAGASAPSAVATATPRTVPAAPAISAVALDTGAVSVTFTLGADGGSALTNVQYSIDGGSHWLTRSPAGTTSPLSITGLTGGVTYPIVLRVLNAAGPSAASNTSSVTAKGTPEASTIEVTEADRSLVVDFTTPVNGGSPITNVAYSLDGGNSWITRSPASTASPLVITGLDNGITYGVRLRAINAAGNGASSNTATATPRTTPSAPAIIGETIVGNDGALDVAFTPPVSDGGSPITTYQYSTDGGATWRDRDSGTTESPVRITIESTDGETALVGGAVYPVEIRAVNAAGPGVASATADGTTTTAPAAPTITSALPSDGTAFITFEPGANGGSPITSFEYRLDGGDWTDTGSLAGSFVLTGLENATEHTLELRAVNAVGAGEPSASTALHISTAPAAPTVDGITAGDRTLVISFTSGPDGGSEIVGYEYSTDGGATWRSAGTATGSPLTITRESAGEGDELGNGTLYAVQLRAVNEHGAGTASDTRLAAPRGVPGAPTNLVATPTDGSAVVTFVLGPDNGSSVTGIEYRIDDGSWIDPGSLNSPLTIPGLVNGTTASIALRARNGIGASPASTAVAVTPRTTPGAPIGLGLSSASNSVTASWTAPTSDGGSPITGYIVSFYAQATGGSALTTCSTPVLTCTKTGLTNGTTLYVSVAAVNAAGAGAPTPRQAQTPYGPPQVAIAGVTATATALVLSTTVTDDGGSAVTGYEYQLDGGSWTSAQTATSPLTISGLTTGQSYTIRIRATNVAGTGAISAPVVAVPHTVPSVPLAVTATGADSSAIIAWDAPATNGGKAITDYVVQYGTNVAGPFTTFADGTSAALTATVTGLTNGTSYVFRVAAVNPAGTGASSALASATPRTTPGAPTITSITPGGKYLTVNFTAPSSNGGSSITGYEYQLDGGTWRNANATSSPFTITGLTNGQTYSVRIRAVNAVGGGTQSSATSAKPYGLPSAIVGFRAVPSGSTVALAWDAVNDNGSAITAYTVIRWSAASEGSIVTSTNTTATSLNVTGLSNGTYWFTIEATNAAGTGPRSAPRTTAIVGSTLPSAPTITSTSVNGTSASMAWTAGAAGTSAIASYMVQYSTDDTTWVTLSSGSASTSANVELPSASAAYSLRVAAVSAAGVGAWATVRPAIVATSTVSGITTSGAAISASVNANNGSVTPSFEFATSSAALGTASSTKVSATPTTATGTSATAVSATLSGLLPYTTYFARAIATGTGSTVSGPAITFTTNASIVTTGLTPLYTGSPVALSATTVPANLQLSRSFTGINGTTYGPSTTPPTGVGTYSVTSSPVDQAIAGSETATITILPKPVTVTVLAQDRAYDGTTDVALTIGLEGAVSGDDVAVDESAISGHLDAPDAGESQTVHVVTSGPLLTGDDAANYAPTIVDEVSANIAKRSQSVSFSSAAPTDALVGDTYVPVAVSELEMPVVIGVDEESADVCTIGDGVITGIAAGDCTVVAEQAGDANTAPAHAEQTFEVHPLVAPSAPTDLGAVISGTTVTLSWTPADPGTSPITRYDVWYTTGDGWVALGEPTTEATATVELPSATTPYQLMVVATSAVGTGEPAVIRPPLVTSSSVITVDAAGATVAGAVNAAGQPVNVRFELATDADLLGTEGATVVVATPDELDGSEDTPVEASFGDLEPATGYAVRMMVTSADATILGPVTTFVTDASIVTDDRAYTYTGSPVAVDTTVLPSGLEVTRTYVGTGSTDYPESTTAPRNIGTYSVTTAPADDSIGGAETVEFSIVSKPITVSVDPIGRAYDGSASVDLDLALVGVADDDDVELIDGAIVGTLDDAGAGADKTVHIAADEVVISGADASNYDVSVPEEATVTITKLAQTAWFVSAAPVGAMVGGTYAVSAATSAERTPWMSIAPASDEVCTIDDGVVTAVGAGTCTIVAGEDGDENIAAAVPVEQSFTVAALPTTTTLPATTTVPPTTTPDTTTPDTTTPTTMPSMLELTLELEAGDSVAGAPVNVHGEGLAPNSPVRIELHSEPILLGIAMTDANGSFATTVMLPMNVSAGQHEIVAIGTSAEGRTVIASKPIFADWSGSLAEVEDGGYVPRVARRILDTRIGGQMLEARSEHRLDVPTGLVPDDATALALNLTVTEPTRAGYITVYPCGADRPLAAAINFAAGETKANLVEVMLPAGGALCLWSNVTTHAVVDLQGAHSPTGDGRLVPRTATRLVDTRSATRIAADDVVRIPVVGAGKAAAGTLAVALNVAVDDPRGAGYLTVYPCGVERPLASNLNFVAGQTVSNEVLVEPGADGTVCVYTTVATQLVVDLDATFEPTGVASFAPFVAGRLADTRTGTKLRAGETVELDALGSERAGVAGANAVALNVAVTEPEAAGFLTIYPCGSGRPLASNLNFAAGQTISNHVTASLSDNGTICVFASQATNIVVDVEGAYFTR